MTQTDQITPATPPTLDAADELSRLLVAMQAFHVAAAKAMEALAYARDPWHNPRPNEDSA
jgi:hypothetical protein